MAASLSTDGFGHGLAQHHKLTKTRNRTVVKPILKKLHSTGSEKNSLDLDRGWDEQPIQYFDSAAGESRAYTATSPRSARDVSFSVSAIDFGTADSRAGLNGLDSAANNRRRKVGLPDKYSHARSTSGASHVSVATSGSGRTGSFVHPFQQTPRASTPPLAQTYGNGATRSSLDYNFGLGLRDYEFTATIAEDNDDTDDSAYTPNTATPSTIVPTVTNASTTSRISTSYSSTAVNHIPAGASKSYHHHRQHSASNGIRRPSLASQRTSSLSDVTSGQSAPRMSTSNRSVPGATPRIPGSVNHSRPELYTSPVSATTDTSPLSTRPTIHNDDGFSSSPQTNVSRGSSSTHAGTPVLAPLRSSLDMGGLRLRSRSSLDTYTRQEQVREARRKFEEKEKAKEEKYEREKNRKRERADTKEAQRQLRKRSPDDVVSGGRTSSSTDIRPMASRQSSGLAHVITQEKQSDTLGRGYESAQEGEKPRAKADDVQFRSAPRRSNAAKKKTTGAWTSFVLWFRTRLLKLGRR